MAGLDREDKRPSPLLFSRHMNSLEQPLSSLGLPKVEAPEPDQVDVEEWMQAMRAEGITTSEVDDVSLRRLLTDSNWDESGLDTSLVKRLRDANWRYNQNKKPDTLAH